MSDTNKEIEGHEYDGIKELDNALPGWWINGFYLCILFAGLYWAYYEMGPGPSIKDTLKQETQEMQLAQLAQNGQKKLPSQEELLALFVKPERRKEGHDIFVTKCVACHGDKGQGGIGPNLTDDYWLHGGKLAQIAATITNGVSDKGMPPWGPMLSGEQIKSLAVFVKSLHGTNPPGAKAPQGELEKD